MVENTNPYKQSIENFHFSVNESLFKKKEAYMSDPIFDLDDSGFIFPTSENIGMDSDGDLNLRISDNISMDLNTGELHINSGWTSDDDKDDL